MIATRNNTSLTHCVQALSLLALARILVRRGDAAARTTPLLKEGMIAAGRHVARALRQANARAWVAVEILLAGETLWESAQVDWERSLEDTFFRPWRALLDHSSKNSILGSPPNELSSLREKLAKAAAGGMLTTGALELPDLLRAAENERAAEDWSAEEFERLALIAKDLEWNGAPELQQLFALSSQDDSSLVVTLVMLCFRQAVLADADLFGDVAPAMAQLALTGAESALAEFAVCLDVHRPRLDALLQAPVAPAEPTPRVQPIKVDPEMRLQRGIALAQRGEYESAIAEFSAELDQDSSRVDALSHRGDAYRLRGAYPQALIDFNAALRLDPEHRASLLSRGQVNWLSREYEQAIADFSALLQLEPSHAVAHHFRGKTHLDAGDARLAAADFTEAQRFAPNSPWPWHDRGDAYAALDEHERAVADYSQALRLNPQATLSYLRRGDAHAEMGAYDLAVNDFNQALHLDPLSAAAYRCRGNAYRHLGQFEQATADFTRALELDDANAEGFSQRGLLFHLRGDHESAVDDLDTAIRLDPTNAELFYQRGRAVAALGNGELALADFSEALRLNPDHADCLEQRGLLHAARDENDQALRDLSSSLRLKPTSAATYAHRARVFGRMGLHDDAIGDCELAIQHDPRLVVAYVMRATMNAQRGNYDVAITDLTRAIELDPNHHHAMFLRGVASAKIGKLAPALEDLSAVIRVDSKNARAFAQRALVLRQAQQHAHAVNDFAHAARLNDYYAAAYCEQLAVFHNTRGEHERAAADYTVALLLEPSNRAFRVAKEKAWRAFQKRVRTPRPAVDPARDAPRRAAQTMMGAPALVTAVAASTAIHQAAETKIELPASSPAQAAPDDEVVVFDETPGETTDFEIASPEHTNAAATDVVPAEVTVIEEVPPVEAQPEETAVEVAEEVREEVSDAERRREIARLQLLEAERAARFAEVARRKAEEERRRDEEESRRKEREKRRKRDDDDEDDRERMPMWKKGILVAAAVLVVWIGSSVAMSLYADYQARMPVTLTRLCKAFSEDADAARKKYDGGIFQLTGKAKFHNTASETRLVLDDGVVPGWTVHCKFEMTPKIYKAFITDGIKPGQEVTVVGRCSYSPKEGKGVILFEECEVRKGL